MRYVIYRYIAAGPGTCAECEKPYEIQDPVVSSNNSGHKLTYHSACFIAKSSQL